MLEYKFYDARNYLLERFSYKEIPDFIIEIIKKLNDKFMVVIRGGLCYILLTEDEEYLLKDIDLAMYEEYAENIIKELQGNIEEVYVNKNTFGQDVITLFFKNKDKYFKIDILLVKKMMEYNKVTSKLLNKEINVMSIQELWYNRLCKIAEKEIRHHDDFKTLNHYRVLTNVSDYILTNKNIKNEMSEKFGIDELNKKFKESVLVLNNLLSEEDLEDYKNRINKILLMEE